ncbi:uncharacterized protein [Anabrus simplex]|uniref:uncharacterized protein n=1 Tax=Anabrus simplex TaxID=316456 RepID=UPI0035A354F9
MFPEVNAVISNVKKVFLKAPSQISAFKNALPDTPLPPQPVLTCWGTWLCAALYYAENVNKIGEVVDIFYEDGVSIIEAKAALQWSHIHFFKFGTATFQNKAAEERESHLLKAVGIVREVEVTMVNFNGPIGAKISAKFPSIMQRNPGWKDALAIAAVLAGNDAAPPLPRFTPAELAAFTYCPLTSCEV